MVHCSKVLLCLMVVVAVAMAGHHQDYYAYPKYKFEYGVSDHHTGDQKQQSESRDGDAVHGHYSLVEPDGSTRSVHYSASKHSGFTAQVTRNGLPLHAPGPQSSPLAYSASLGYGHGYAKVSRAH